MITFPRLILVTLLAVTCSACSSFTPLVQPPLPSRADEVAAFKPVTPEVWTLPNGLEVVYLPDSELPIVRGRLFIRGGSLWTPDAPTGAVGAMGELMRQGGIADVSADDLDKELEKLAASVGASFGGEFGSASFSCLASDFERVFSLFSKVLLTPRFESEKIALWKGQALEGIRRRKDDASTVASITFNQILYGDSPYGRAMTTNDVKKINRSDLQRLHKELVKPDGAVLVVTGRIQKEQLAAVVESQLGKWEARGAELPPAPEVPSDPRPGVYFVELPFSQATLFVGHLGLPRLTPDYPAIEVFNEVFGASGFGSRLMQRVRTEKGLSYSIYGGIAPGVVKGINYVSEQTKAESVDEALLETLHVLHELQTVPIGEVELLEKKAAIRNSFVFNFESADNVAGRLAKLRLLKYPEDYDATFLDKIDAVTPSDVQGVASGRWSPQKFVVVVIGNQAAYQRLEALKSSPNGGASAELLKSFDLKKLSFDQVAQLE